MNNDPAVSGCVAEFIKACKLERCSPRFLIWLLATAGVVVLEVFKEGFQAVVKAEIRVSDILSPRPRVDGNTIEPFVENHFVTLEHAQRTFVDIVFRYYVRLLILVYAINRVRLIKRTDHSLLFNQGSAMQLILSARYR